jgi:hypothetical protein
MTTGVSWPGRAGRERDDYGLARTDAVAAQRRPFTRRKECRTRNARILRGVDRVEVARDGFGFCRSSTNRQAEVVGTVQKNFGAF